VQLYFNARASKILSLIILFYYASICVMPQLELATFFNQSLIFFLFIYVMTPLISWSLERVYVRPRMLGMVYSRASFAVLGSDSLYRPMFFSSMQLLKGVSCGERESFTFKFDTSILSHLHVISWTPWVYTLKLFCKSTGLISPFASSQMAEKQVLAWEAYPKCTPCPVS
jgi:hypothetical protein